MTDTTKPGPCPFCGGAMHVRSNRDWHRIFGEHSEECFFDSEREQMMVPATDVDLAEMIAAWNRRPSPSVHRQASAGQEGVISALTPVAWVVASDRSTITSVTDNRARVSSLRKYPHTVIEPLVRLSDVAAALSTAAPESKEPSREVLFSEECFAPVHEGTVIDDWLIPLDTDLPKLEPGFSWQRVTRVIYRAAAPTAGETL